MRRTSLFAGPENSFVEIKHGGKITVFTDEIRYLFRFFVKYFAYGKGVIFAEGTIPHLTEKLADTMGLPQHGIHTAETVFPVRRIIMHRQRFFDVYDGVYAETAQSFVQPPVYVFIYFFAHLRVFPV